MVTDCYRVCKGFVGDEIMMRELLWGVGWCGMKYGVMGVDVNGCGGIWNVGDG